MFQCNVNAITMRDDEGGAQFGMTKSSHSQLDFKENYLDVNQ